MESEKPPQQLYRLETAVQEVCSDLIDTLAESGITKWFDGQKAREETRTLTRDEARSIINKIFFEIMSGFSILPLSDQECLTAVKIIRNAFTQEPYQGLPQGGIDRNLLITQLNQAGIRNNITIPIPQDLANMQRAETLGLSLQEFVRLRERANSAYERFVRFGPAYGTGPRGETSPPFRVTAEPIARPLEEQQVLMQYGALIGKLWLAVTALPTYLRKNQPDLFDILTFSSSPKQIQRLLQGTTNLPLAWRIDAIIPEDGNQIAVNEIEMRDGAIGLMPIEQAAYSESDPSNYTATYFATSIVARMKETPNGRPICVLFLETKDGTNYCASVERFLEQLETASSGLVTGTVVQYGVDLEQRVQVDTSGQVLVDDKPVDLIYDYNVTARQTDPLSQAIMDSFDQGMVSFINPPYREIFDTKLLMALVWDDRLRQYWIDTLGSETALEETRSMFPRSEIVTNLNEITPGEDWVVKVADGNLEFLGQARGVIGPWSSQEDIQRFKQLWKDNRVVLIRQKFIKPLAIEAFLRKGPNMLESVSWPNRICASYVLNPSTKQVILTAVEMTLDQNIPVKGTHRCAMTAVQFH